MANDKQLPQRGEGAKTHEKSRAGPAWEEHSLQLPENAGVTKSVNAGEINLVGAIDIVFTCEKATSGRLGMMWMSYPKTMADTVWDTHEISGPDGVIELTIED